MPIDLDRQLARDAGAADLDARVVWRGQRPYAVTRQGARRAETPLPSNLLELACSEPDTVRTLLARAAHENAEKLRS